MSIILVGNGTSILDNENGVIIDSYADVVRFNSFKIKGYERYTGVKTNIWVTVNKHHLDNADQFDKIIFHSWADENKCKLFKEIKSVIECCKISKEIIESIDIVAPSTGLIAIHYFLQHHKQITLTGFDWWERDAHHYGDKEIRGNIHKPKKEFEIINRLVLEDKVRFL